MDLKGKRLLVLGGSLWKETIRQVADAYGITLVATGTDTTAGIFEIADEGYSINSTDAEAMKKLIVEKKIDGVYMGGSEPVIAAASQYLNELHMPCYCTYEQWEYLQNKEKLKELYIRHGLPVAKRFSVSSESLCTIPTEEFPVITKPVDGCGSSGFSVCHTLEELQVGYRAAVVASTSGRVLVEKFVPNDGVVAIYRMSNGKLLFCGLEEKYPVRYEKQGSYVAGLFTFPSDKTAIFRERYEAKLENMLRSIGITEGPLWFEVFTDGNEFCFNEVGYRYGGSVTVYPTQYFANINEVAADIYYALTGESKVEDFVSMIPDSVERDMQYGVYAIHLSPGTITAVDGIEQLLALPNVIAVPITKAIGTQVADCGTIAQVFSFVHFLFKGTADLLAMIDRIHRTLRVTNECGTDMVLRMLNSERIR